MRQIIPGLLCVKALGAAAQFHLERLQEQRKYEEALRRDQHFLQGVLGYLGLRAAAEHYGFNMYTGERLTQRHPLNWPRSEQPTS